MGVRGFGCVWRVRYGYSSLWLVRRASDMWEWVGIHVKGLGSVRGY